jgi:hypothetical protein
MNALNDGRDNPLKSRFPTRRKRGQISIRDATAKSICPQHEALVLRPVVVMSMTFSKL